ncbi:neuropeptide Y receptor type 2-like [Mytilus galloprovincialis]|uniref:Neuropeptide Y receptor, invertebrate n=2 Tax=Mytilus galloprovincialis TaxID=29158 RepID=A0A8B6EA06_MYTGA|nr:neuropeptide Y receptor, invertebrate [Mytilus galloprovincialis]
MENTTNMTNATMDSNHTITDQVMHKPVLMGIFVLLYCIIFLLGVSGNTLVVYVVVRNKTMQTITNIFITNLAVSDILMCLLAVPFTPLGYFLQSWVFGEALCHIVPMSLGICVYVSTLTSTAIAVDRYFVIVYPFKPRMKVFVCLLMIVAIWVISISISLPLGIYMELTPQADESFMCREKWPRVQAGQFFTVTSLILQYIVPCSIITYCYTKVSLALKKRSRSKIGSGSKSRERDEMEIKRKRRTNKMLIAMVTIFVCCWLPLNIVLLTAEYISSFSKWYFYTLLFFSAHVIAMSSTIYNPFLYAWMNDNFKKEFKQVLPFLFRRDRERPVNGSYTQYTHVDNQPSVVINKSPQKDPDDNKLDGKVTKAYYDTESEKVQLNVNHEGDTEDSV